MRRVYNCNICEATYSQEALYGIVFKPGSNDFTLGGAGATDGKHICAECADVFRRELNKIYSGKGDKQ